MSFNSKANRRHANVLCGEATKVTAQKRLADVAFGRRIAEERLIAQQEDSMWAEYRAEQAALLSSGEQEALLPSSDTAEEHVVDVDSATHEPEDSCEHEDAHSRFAITDSGPAHMYPAKKDGHTTKDRRYRPQTKFSDRDKALGKVPGRKATSYRQLKGASMPLESGDLTSPDGELGESID